MFFLLTTFLWISLDCFGYCANQQPVLNWINTKTISNYELKSEEINSTILKGLLANLIKPPPSTIKPENPDIAENNQSWAIIWYVASFGGLIAFFLIISCAEFCCRRRIRNNMSNNNLPDPTVVIDTPPPPYEQFAPPSYESISCDKIETTKKREFDVYVVPIQTLQTILENRNE